MSLVIEKLYEINSIVMWDVWAVYDDNSCTYLLGKTVDGFTCDFNGISIPVDIQAARDEAISYAAYRIFFHRFANSPNPDILQNGYDNHMSTLGYDINVTSTDYSTGSAAALGNYIAQCIINFGLQDGSNEQNEYGNQFYQPVNQAMIVDTPGNPNLTDFNMIIFDRFLRFEDWQIWGKVLTQIHQIMILQEFH